MSDTERSNLESPSIKFPDKVKMAKGHRKASSFIPKLDFTKVQQKYMSENVKKQNPLEEVKKKTMSKNEELFEKLKTDLKAAQKGLNEYKSKYERYKHLCIELKEKLKDKNDKIRKSSFKIESLEAQVRKSFGFAPSTDDVSYKRNDNTSTVYIYINIE